MTNYVVYDTADGRVKMEGVGPLASVNPQDFGSTMAVLAYDGGLSFDEVYVSGGQVVPKQPLNLQTTKSQIFADGVDECVIGNIPVGVSVMWPDGQADEVLDGEVRFSVDLPGTYTLTFDAVPYLRQEVTIEAVAAA